MWERPKMGVLIRRMLQRELVIGLVFLFKGPEFPDLRPEKLLAHALLFKGITHAHGMKIKTLKNYPTYQGG